MPSKKSMEDFVNQCPGFSYSAHPTPTSALYVFSDSHVCTSLYEAYNYAHVMNGRIRMPTAKEKYRWDRGEPVPGMFESKNGGLYIDTETAADVAFAWDEISGRHD